MLSRELVFDILVLVSCAIMTLGIIGIVRMPDIYTKLHGASKSVFLGVVLLCISASVVATSAMNKRLIVIAILVVLTTPLASHVIGRGAFIVHEEMESPGAVDESHVLIETTPITEQHEPIWRL